MGLHGPVASMVTMIVLQVQGVRIRGLDAEERDIEHGEPSRSLQVLLALRCVLATTEMRRRDFAVI